MHPSNFYRNNLRLWLPSLRLRPALATQRLEMESARLVVVRVSCRVWVRVRAHVRDWVEVGGVRVGAPRHLLPRADDGVVQLPQPRQVLVVHDLCTCLAGVSVAV